MRNEWGTAAPDKEEACLVGQGKEGHLKRDGAI